MKGMQKIKRGKGFGGLMNYLLSHDKAEEDGRVIGGTINSFDKKSIVKEFGKVRALRPDIEKPVWHNSLRLPENEVCSDYKWQEIVEDYLTRLGVDVQKTQYIIVKHDDENAVHIAMNRISKTGKVYTGENENLASTRHISDLEKVHGLTVTKGLEYDENNRIIKTDTPRRSRKTAAEIQKQNRTGELVPRDRIKYYVEAALGLGACSAPEFAKRLRAVGVSVRANVTPNTRTMSGFTFAIAENNKAVSFKGSDVSASWATLQKAGVSYDKDRDYLDLAALSKDPAVRVAAIETTAKQALWDEQSAVLDADTYTVHCVSPDPLKTREIDPIPYSAKEIRDAIPDLEKLEQEGYDLHVTPASEKWDYMRLNAVPENRHLSLLAQGFTPTLSVQIADKCEEVFKVPKAPQNRFIEQALGAEFGSGKADQKIPLAGFRNSGFVTKIVQKTQDFCQAIKRTIDAIAARVKKAPVQAPQAAPVPVQAPSAVSDLLGVSDADLALIKKVKVKGPEIPEDDIVADRGNVPTQGRGAAIRAKLAGIATEGQKPKSQSDDLSL